jgi:hypothetical protein
MTKYTVTVRATYVREMEIEADDELAARHLAIQKFEPEGDDLFSIDVFGLDPWRPIDDREDREYEAYRQEKLDHEA